MSCHKSIVVITGRAHCFHDYIYITPILLLWDLSTLCVVDHIWPLILHSFFSLLSTLWFIGTSNVPKCMSCHKAVVVITGSGFFFFIKFSIWRITYCQHLRHGTLSHLFTLCHTCDFPKKGKKMLKKGKIFGNLDKNVQDLKIFWKRAGDCVRLLHATNC